MKNQHQYDENSVSNTTGDETLETLKRQAASMMSSAMQVSYQEPIDGQYESESSTGNSEPGNETNRGARFDFRPRRVSPSTPIQPNRTKNNGQDYRDVPHEDSVYNQGQENGNEMRFRRVDVSKNEISNNTSTTPLVSTPSIPNRIIRRNTPYPRSDKEGEPCYIKTNNAVNPRSRKPVKRMYSSAPVITLSIIFFFAVGFLFYGISVYNKNMRDAEEMENGQIYSLSDVFNSKEFFDDWDKACNDYNRYQTSVKDSIDASMGRCSNDMEKNTKECVKEEYSRIKNEKDKLVKRHAEKTRIEKTEDHTPSELAAVLKALNSVLDESLTELEAYNPDESCKSKTEKKFADCLTEKLEQKNGIPIIRATHRDLKEMHERGTMPDFIKNVFDPIRDRVSKDSLPLIEKIKEDSVKKYIGYQLTHAVNSGSITALLAVNWFIIVAALALLTILFLVLCIGVISVVNSFKG